MSAFLHAPLYRYPVLLSHPNQHRDVITEPNLLSVSGWPECDIARLAGMGYYLRSYSYLSVPETPNTAMVILGSTVTCIP